MAIKNVIKDELKNKEKIVNLRYNSSKLVFVLVTLLFFVNLFLYSAGLYLDFFQSSVSILYFLLVVSLAFFIYFFAVKKFQIKLSGNKQYILVGVVILLSVALLVPMVLKHI